MSLQGDAPPGLDITCEYIVHKKVMPTNWDVTQFKFIIVYRLRLLIGPDAYQTCNLYMS